MSARFVLQRTVEPATEPLTLNEVKRHLRCYDDITSEDDMISSLIVAAREWVEDFTNRALITQTWRLSIGDRVAVDTVNQPRVYCGRTEGLGTEIFTRISPVTAITAFVSVDSAGVETAVEAANYELREGTSRWPRVAALNGASWASGEYRVTFTAGFATIPTRLKQAMLLWIEAMYDRDEKMMEILLDTAERLARPERVDIGFA